MFDCVFTSGRLKATPCDANDDDDDDDVHYDDTYR